jgi:hypothetical protein
MSMSFDRRPERLGSLITINRELAAGLRGQDPAAVPVRSIDQR